MIWLGDHTALDVGGALAPADTSPATTDDAPPATAVGGLRPAPAPGASSATLATTTPAPGLPSSSGGARLATMAGVVLALLALIYFAFKES